MGANASACKEYNTKRQIRRVIWVIVLRGAYDEVEKKVAIGSDAEKID